MAKTASFQTVNTIETQNSKRRITGSHSKLEYKFTSAKSIFKSYLHALFFVMPCLGDIPLLENEQLLCRVMTTDVEGCKCNVCTCIGWCFCTYLMCFLTCLNLRCVTNIMWLTNQRIIIKESLSMYCCELKSTYQSYRYRDLQHMTFTINRRPTYGAMGAILVVIGIIWMIVTGHGVQFSVGAGIFVAGICADCVFLSNICVRYKLSLDFYKKETVNSWFGDLASPISKKGSSFAKILDLKKHDSLMVMQIIYGHPLGPLAERDDEKDDGDD